MRVEIWSNGCPICEQAKAFFKKVKQYDHVRIVELDEMIGGKTDEDCDALSEIMIEQDGTFPLVKVDGVRILPKTIIAMLDAWDDAEKQQDWPHGWEE